MKLKSIYRNAIIAICVLCWSSCDNQWDDHVEIKNNRENETIMQVIESNPETSVFASILKKTGYNELLSSDKSLTVFAPVNSSLQGVNMEDKDELLSIVRNHIAYLSYSVVNRSFTADTIEMINSKRLKTDGLDIDKVSVKDGQYNITTANGLLHLVEGVITTKLNIWEYLKTQDGYALVDFIESLDHLVMDPEKSVQVGIDPSGRPVYDTVWINQNNLLQQYPINQETRNYTFILLNTPTSETIGAKFAKYYVRPTQAQQDSIVKAELVKDCILLPVQVSGPGRYMSVDGVLIDINSAATEKYEASNGIVYKVADADVKVYQNKLKDIQIEAENYYSVYADGNAWSQRQRTWSSGGRNMMLNSVTRNFFRDSVEVDGEKVWINETYTYRATASSGTATNNGYMGRTNNCYIEFRPVLNSVPYKVYVKAGDDIRWHYIATQYSSTPSPYWYPMILEQKMLISFPDEEKLARTAEPNEGSISNNFSENTVLVAKSQAGPGEEETESQFLRYNVSTTAADLGIFIVPGTLSPDFTAEDPNVYQNSDQYGDKEQIICPRYGESTVFVANTVREKNVNSGVMFLDYIRFVPLVDVND